MPKQSPRTEDLARRRRERLREELLDEALIGSLIESAIDELAYADRPPVQEGRLAPYGAIIVEEGPTPAAPIEAVLPSLRVVATADTPADLRMYADGYSTFVLREGSSHALVVVASLGYSESDLVRAAEGSKATIVRRSASGQVSVIVPGRVAWRSGGGWEWKPTYMSYLHAVLEHVPPTTTKAPPAPLLDLCVHGLSSLGIGATLVWSLMPGGLDRVDHLDRSHAIESIKLRIDREYHAAFCSAAAQLDRAILIDEDGRVDSLGVTLLRPEVEYEGTERGTRHDSAAVLSAGYPHLMIFVVSSDGPVTVYRNGRAIVSTRAAQRQVEESLLCDCVRDHLPIRETDDEDETEDDVRDAWQSAGRLADPTCPICGGDGIVSFEYNMVQPLDDVL